MRARVDYKAFGRRIRAYRQTYHLTQAQLAENADVSMQFIGNLERGIAIPSVETLISLCYALEVDPGLLLADSLPEGGFSDPPECVLRSAGSRFRNTLSDWLLEDGEFGDEAPVDLSKLPPIGFMTLDDEFPLPHLH